MTHSAMPVFVLCGASYVAGCRNMTSQSSYDERRVTNSPVEWFVLHRNPSKLGTWVFISYREVSVTQGFTCAHVCDCVCMYLV